MKKTAVLLSLLLTRLWVFLFNLVEEGKVRFYFYKNPTFKKVDKALKKAYQGTNPYLISKSFLESTEARDLYTYGETPLSALYAALKACSPSKKDVFFDLGCGRGRLVLFVSSFLSIKSVGVERIPLFCTLANKIAREEKLQACFLQKDLLHADIHSASIIYLCPLLIEEDLVRELIPKISQTTVVITANIPLSDYCSSFFSSKIQSSFLPWGKANLYKNIKKNLQKHKERANLPPIRD